ncbi:type I secretion protein [Aquicoccus porphyridii]|uniref:Type I secretion protein n=1 Tax=Aquicoccus porphyridii TaxID=1852029 RepID=A0A5A9ZC78_9RHOB|nr:Hint domain-containing protein [Aquicoccus porphyridii]KAA0914679.1 type I secretion protein [Aquicoccus porphyridii]RAI53297.1 type I secretion protein [Rhodobacteraceae bacterium AsT-22]
MPTTFNWIHLGQSATTIDPVEGNTLSEDAGLLVGSSYGTAGDPLYEHVTRATMIDNGGSFTALDTNNNTSNDQFVTDIGNGPETFTYDGVAVYQATLTYSDGTTASFTAIVAQDTQGHLFLAPPLSFNADVATLTARPIESITLDNMIANNGNLGADRQDIGIKDGIVQGTAGDDLIDASYIEPLENGSDRVDNDDAPDGGHADVIEAGAGNDTVLAGLGDDTVHGGTGDDLIDGGAGDDLLFGEDGNDTLFGSTGNDSLFGGAGNDVIHGDGPLGGRWEYEVYTRDFSSANGQAFTIETGTLAGSGSADAFDIRGLGQAATGQGDPNDFGVIYTSTLHAPDSGTYRFETTSDDGSTIRILDAEGNPLTFTNQNGTTESFMNNDYHQAATTRWGEVELDADTLYTIEVRFWENAGQEVLSAQVTPPGGTAEDLATSELVIGPEGDGGDDVIDGGEGADLIFGGAGNDTIFAGQDDTIFGGDGDDLFILTDPGEPGSGTIFIDGGADGTSDNDTLDLDGAADRTTLTQTPSTLDPDAYNGTVTLLDGTIVNFSNIENIICFTPGTLIATPAGPRAAETLRPGDLVLTRDDGAQPLGWAGRSTVPGMGKFAPIRLDPALTGARRALTVSPQHRMMIEDWRAELLFGEAEVFMPAIHMLDFHGADAAPVAQVTYIHLMFDRHQVIYAEGAATESFHASDQSLDALVPAARAEIFAAYPALRHDLAAHGPTARPCLKSYESHALLTRMHKARRTAHAMAA